MAPYLFGVLIQSHTASRVFIGYLIAAGLMIFGGLTEIFFGVDSERRSLEEIAAADRAFGGGFCARGRPNCRRLSVD